MVHQRLLRSTPFHSSDIQCPWFLPIRERLWYECSNDTRLSITWLISTYTQSLPVVSVGLNVILNILLLRFFRSHSKQEKVKEENPFSRKTIHFTLPCKTQNTPTSKLCSCTHIQKRCSILGWLRCGHRRDKTTPSLQQSYVVPPQ